MVAPIPLPSIIHQRKYAWLHLSKNDSYLESDKSGTRCVFQQAILPTRRYAGARCMLWPVPPSQAGIFYRNG